MGLEKKMIYRLKKTKYMVINMGKESEEVYNRRKSKRRNSSRNRYLQVPGKGKQKLGNSKDHILELNTKCEVINREIIANWTKHHVGKEEIRVELKL